MNTNPMCPCGNFYSDELDKFKWIDGNKIYRCRFCNKISIFSMITTCYFVRIKTLEFTDEKSILDAFDRQSAIIEINFENKLFNLHGDHFRDIENNKNHREQTLSEYKKYEV